MESFEELGAKQFAKKNIGDHLNNFYTKFRYLDRSLDLENLSGKNMPQLARRIYELTMEDNFDHEAFQRELELREEFFIKCQNSEGD
jgi:hypothetical protein